MSILLKVRNTFARSGGDRLAMIIGAVVTALIWGLAASVMVFGDGTSASAPAIGIGVAGYSVVAALATLAAFAARKGTTGVEARTWRTIAWGLLSWTTGGVTYLVFLLTGGSHAEPAAWSQAGYLLAYPFWYIALWRLRQPVLASSRKNHAETLAIEVAAVLMLSLVVGSLLWNPLWPIDQNVAQLIPAILDILLLATFYGAVRRTRWTSSSALAWLGYSFSVLALSDMMTTYVLQRGMLVMGGISFTGYVIAMILAVIATRRPLRVAEVQSRVRGTTGVVAVGGLTLAGLAIVVAPTVLRPLALLTGALLAWRTFAILSERDNSDTDILTGFLELRAFERHLAGVIQHSSPDRPSSLIVIDLNDFGAWNARNGYNAGDALLSAVAKTLESDGPAATAWGRLKGDRFALTTVSHGIDADRDLAERLRSITCEAAAPLQARAAIVQIPMDAHTATQAIDAADEALRAGAEAHRAVVAYAMGGLDGIVSSVASASLSTRRDRIHEIINSPTAISVYLQPVVRLDDLRIHGFEALSRFDVEPRLAPDQWIAEATRLGLGIDLEVECARRAWVRHTEVPAPACLSLNASPDAIMSDLFTDTFAAQNLEGLVLEITEHERVSDYPRLAAQLDVFRARGAQIAIDDTGAGHASLHHLLRLKPDYIKLDRQLVTGVDVDPAKNAVVRNMLQMADDLGAELVAEGIETDGELWALRALGVPYGQGFHLGRPAPRIDHHVGRLGIEGSERPRLALPPQRVG